MKQHKGFMMDEWIRETGDDGASVVLVHEVLSNGEI